jgi:DnaJ-class molecular chaperone
MTRNYYEILGVDKDATQEQIKKAYRELALKYHPDRNRSPDATQKTQEINEAYAVLINEDSRKMYDRVGSENFFDFSFNPESDPEYAKMYERYSRAKKRAENLRKQAENTEKMFECSNNILETLTRMIVLGKIDQAFFNYKYAKLSDLDNEL